ncbi:MAG TPA: preprotein translocase subunit SecG [Acidisoma sp.]|jgi:preprotein translocase subunit SecG|uniref:preprotein translocase subunit SecG n=1 Tax=Acidisoma sp. TaxID=1872115 RepID=UPI002C4B36AA|nr:preprotein translocase subunit SecG [Acidisoma sp.]HTI01440.1 preprotein translocase subunit SecG [Acidisoma sp.]
MFTVLLVIHVFVTLALIGVVLVQRSEGGGLGIGGGQGMGSFMTGRGTANLLTRTTAILATIFLALSLVLALMTRNSTSGVNAIFNAPASSSPAPLTLPGTTPAPGAGNTAPAQPAAPSAPAKPSAPAAP